MDLVSTITLMFPPVPSVFLPSGTLKTLSITTIYIYVPYVPSILYINIIIVYIGDIGINITLGKFGTKVGTTGTWEHLLSLK